jgi:hypothetical protein
VLTFEEFWVANFEEYRALARAKYEHQTGGRWFAIVSIDSDDDFLLDIDHDFKMYGASKDELMAELVLRLNSSGFEYLKTWSMTDSRGNRTSGDYTAAWTNIRDEAIKQLNEGNHCILFGGNRTIEISIAAT